MDAKVETPAIQRMFRAPWATAVGFLYMPGQANWRDFSATTDEHPGE